MLRSQSRIVIVADDVLRGVPFEALVEQIPAGQVLEFSNVAYLGRRFEINYALSGKSLEGLIPTEEEGGGVLAVGFSSTPQISELRLHGQPDRSLGGQVPALPGVGDELACITHALHGSVCVLDEGGNLKSQFLESASRYRVLHIAGHVGIDQDRPIFSRVYLSQSSVNSESDALYAYEMMSLRTRANLVVLSGCSTAWSQNEEDLDGFTLSLFYIGVPSVVGSLWSVGDQATAQFMAAFYKYLKQGERKSRALQLAKIDMMDSGRADPFYWAPFVLLGDPSPITLEDPPWFGPGKTFLCGAVIVFLAAIILRVKRQF